MKKTVVDFLENLKTGLLNFLYPPVCLICSNRIDEQTNFLCETCKEKIEPSFRVLPGSELTYHENIDEVLFLFDFDPMIQSLIHIMKYRNFHSLASYFGREIAQSGEMRAVFDELDFLTAVPLHPSRLRERGYNQSEIFGKEIARESQIPFLSGSLKRIRYTSSQTKLSAQERLKNVEGAFIYNNTREITDKKIGICDDVVTTGATMDACAEALKRAGAKEIYGIVISRPLK